MKQAQIKGLLPSVFQRALQEQNPLSSILDVMESMHAPPESALDNFAVTFNPHRTPDPFVPYLASWVDLEVLLDVPHPPHSATPSLSTGMGRLRELAAAAGLLSQWRGTRKGLTLFLETATGLTGFLIEEQVRGPDNTIRPFHMRITAPAELTSHRILVERIIELEKPAYVTYELEFGSSQQPLATQ